VSLESNLIITIAIITAIGVFAGPIIAFVVQDLKRKRNEKLGIHFEDIKGEVIDHIIQMTRNLTIRNDRLVFGSYSDIRETYPFEQGDYYTHFKVHFPKEAEKWEQFNIEALNYAQTYEPLRHISARLRELKNMQVHQRPENWATENEKYEKDFKDMSQALTSDTEDLMNRCRTFSIHLSNRIENISKYGIGKEFKKIKRCTICKKF